MIRVNINETPLKNSFILFLEKYTNKKIIIQLFYGVFSSVSSMDSSPAQEYFPN